jgi:predicted acyltransferase
MSIGPTKPSEAENDISKTTGRLRALDTFRGLTIAGMILVNMPGSWSHVYAPLRHAKWHGCTPTDLVFPFFLFIVGVAMTYSFKKYDNKLSPTVLKKIAKRVVLIFVIGLFLNAFPFHKDLSQLRILGVLQRIAIVYGIAALLYLALSRTRLVFLSAILLVVYWLLLLSFGQGDPYALETNLVRTIDLKILGRSHVWGGFGIPFDPEGLLSTLPAVVTAILGAFTGRLIQTASRLRFAVVKLLLAGSAAIVLGRLWNLVFPINKALWTSSYVIYTSGLAMLFLAVLLWLIDVRGYKKWAFPFVVFGMNPLFLYALHALWVRTYLYLIKFKTSDGTATNAYQWLYQNIFAPLAGPLNGSLLFAISHVFLFWLILLVLYRRRIFIKI